MRKKRKTPSNDIAGNVVGCFNPCHPSPKDRIRQLESQIERSDVEKAANEAEAAMRTVVEARQQIQYLDAELHRQRELVTQNLLRHQQALAKVKQLTEVPQPTV